MKIERELLECAGRVLNNLRRALDEDGEQGAVRLRQVLADLGRIEQRIGGLDSSEPAQEVVRRYLDRLRAALEDLLVRRLRGDPGCDEILTGEVLPLAEGIEGLCRSLRAGGSGEPPPAAKEA